MAKKPAPQNCPVKSHSNIKKVPCCDTQQISLNQSSEATPSAVAKTQIKDSEQNFDVLFVYTLFKNWFGSSDQEEEDSEKPSPGLFIFEALILLLQQFRL